MEKTLQVQFDFEKLRETRGVRSIKEVAKLVGIQPSTLCNYEAGIRKPSPTILARLCLLYGVQISDLVTRQQHEFAA